MGFGGGFDGVEGVGFSLLGGSGGEGAEGLGELGGEGFEAHHGWLVVVLF